MNIASPRNVNAPAILPAPTILNGVSTTNNITALNTHAHAGAVVQPVIIAIKSATETMISPI